MLCTKERLVQLVSSSYSLKLTNPNLFIVIDFSLYSLLNNLKGITFEIHTSKFTSTIVIILRNEYFYEVSIAITPLPPSLLRLEFKMRRNSHQVPG